MLALSFAIANLLLLTSFIFATPSLRGLVDVAKIDHPSTSRRLRGSTQNLVIEHPLMELIQFFLNLQQNPGSLGEVEEYEVVKVNQPQEDILSRIDETIVDDEFQYPYNQHYDDAVYGYWVNNDDDNLSYDTLQLEISHCNCIVPIEECNPDGIVCPLDYNPVCGCDKITYSNACTARFFGCNRSWSPGKCAAVNA